MTNTSSLAAAEPKLRPSPKLKPFTVRRHDMWGPSRTHAPHHAEHDVSLYQPIDPVDVATPAWLLSLLPVATWPFRMIALTWRRQGEARDLRGLDDHMLRDMGLTRSEIRDALRKGQHPHPDRD